MNTVRSADGTTIAYTRAGQGPPLILIDGALCSRAFGPMPKLAEQLTPHFTVYTYDRRGRGESSDTAPYAPDREIALTAAEWAAVKVPTLVAAGGKSPAWIANGTRALAEALPDATYRTLPGQNHMVKPQAIAPVLTDFFTTGN